MRERDKIRALFTHILQYLLPTPECNTRILNGRPAFHGKSPFCWQPDRELLMLQVCQLASPCLVIIWPKTNRDSTVKIPQSFPAGRQCSWTKGLEASRWQILYRHSTRLSRLLARRPLWPNFAKTCECSCYDAVKEEYCHRAVHHICIVWWRWGSESNAMGEVPDVSFLPCIVISFYHPHQPSPAPKSLSPYEHENEPGHATATNAITIWILESLSEVGQFVYCHWRFIAISVQSTYLSFVRLWGILQSVALSDCVTS
jgi:hypothetical protein